MANKVIDPDFSLISPEWVISACGEYSYVSKPVTYSGYSTCKLTAMYDSSETCGWARVYQTGIDLRCVSNITFKYRTETFINARMEVYVNGVSASTLYGYSSAWYTVTITLAAGQKIANGTIDFRVLTTAANLRTAYITQVIANSTESTPNSVTVNATEASGGSVCIDTEHTVHFLGTSTGACPTPVSYEWDFGDGESSSLQNPEHTYANSGTYTVKLRAYNSLGYSNWTEMTNYVNVWQRPVSDFNASQTRALAGDEIQLIPDISAIPDASLYNWKINGANTPSGSDWAWAPGSSYDSFSPIVIFNVEATYDVSLIASNVYCSAAHTSDETTKTDYIEITLPVPPSGANFSASDRTPYTDIVVRFTPSLSNEPYPDPVYQWWFGDAHETSDEPDLITSGSELAIHAYGDAGEYTVSLNVTNGYDPDSFISKLDYMMVAEAPPVVSGVYFDGIQLTDPEPYNEAPVVQMTETLLLNGRQNAQISPVTIFSRSFTCRTETYSEVEDIQAKIGVFGTLVVNGVSYENCYIRSFPSLVEELPGLWSYSIGFGQRSIR